MALTIYKASAGSGKTFTLAVEYISKLIADPSAYRHVLAVTFTNKATDEMKTRILQQLYGIWQEDEGSAAYLQSIRQLLAEKGISLSSDDIRQRAGVALRRIAHDYSRFQITTIDSFFQTVLRNLARELNLSSRLNIEMDNDKVLGEAVDEMIRKLTFTSRTLAWILDYMQEKIDKGQHWNVVQAVKDFSRNIFNESYIEQGKALRQSLKNPDLISDFKKILFLTAKETRETLQTYYNEFIRILHANSLEPADLYRGNSSPITSYFKKLSEADDLRDKAMPKSLSKYLDDAQAWSTQKSPRRDDITSLAQSVLIPLMRKAEDSRKPLWRTLVSCEASLKHLNQLQLLNSIDEEVHQANAEQNRFILSDTAALLNQLVQTNDASFVFEKIGNDIHHVMIDEFQDTSRMQWNNFRILLEEIIARGNDSLIVGDVKQSIYRWRNGDWSILNNLGDDATPPSYALSVRHLNDNRRSQLHVVNFNNCFFKFARNRLNAMHQSEFGEDCTPLVKAYGDVEQHPVTKEEKGYVKMAFLDGENTEAYQQETIKALANEVSRLLEQGIRRNDIAILIRKNKYIPPIAEYFEEHLHETIVSDEAFQLRASVAVQILMDALRYLHNADDGIAKASLLMNLHPSIYIYNSIETLPAEFTDKCSELRELPLYELLESLYRIFHLDKMPGQDAYMLCFFDAVTDYLQDNSPDIGAFISYWDDTLSTKTIPSDESDGIRIMSIHKAKGLEYPTVIIPFCSWSMENETNDQLMWCKPEEEPYDMLDLIPVNYSEKISGSVFRDDYLKEKLQLWVDNLNTLYVAFTRAKNNLIVLGRKKSREFSVSTLLLDAMNDENVMQGGTWDQEQCIFEKGQLDTDTKQETTASNKLAQPMLKQDIQMVSIMPVIEFRQSNQSADFMAGVSEEESWRHYINHGKMMHKLFSDIRTKADIDNAIDRMVFDGIIGDAKTEQETRTFTHRVFSNPRIADWYSGEWELFNECDIIWQTNGILHNRRPDRVMMKGNEIVVVDFKFGKPNSKYVKQVQGYMQLLSDMGYTSQHISGYLWYVDEEIIEQV